MHLNKMKQLKKILLLLYCIISMLYSFSQQTLCNDEIIINTKGSWKKHSDANMNAANQSQVISRIDKMQKILQAAYTNPRGIEARWYRTMINDPLIINGPLPYQLNVMFQIYYCLNENKIELGDETSTWMYVYANHFNWFMEYNHDFTVKKNPVYLLTKKVGEMQGYPVYEGIHNGTSNTGTRYSRAVILTRPGQSPYIPVTQKQYLKAFLLFNEKRLPETIAGIENGFKVKTDAQEQESKQKALESIAKNTNVNAVERRKAEYLKNYKTDKQSKEDFIARVKKDYQDVINPVQDLLANSSEQEKGQPAIVDNIDFLKFKGFSTEAKNGRQMVRLNPDYFDSKLPKYIPQFLIVYWRWEKNKFSENFKNELETNFNFNALKAMIDK